MHVLGGAGEMEGDRGRGAEEEIQGKQKDVYRFTILSIGYIVKAEALDCEVPLWKEEKCTCGICA